MIKHLIFNGSNRCVYCGCREQPHEKTVKTKEEYDAKDGMTTCLDHDLKVLEQFINQSNCTHYQKSPSGQEIAIEEIERLELEKLLNQSSEDFWGIAG